MASNPNKVAKRVIDELSMWGMLIGIFMGMAMFSLSPDLNLYYLPEGATEEVLKITAINWLSIGVKVGLARLAVFGFKKFIFGQYRKDAVHKGLIDKIVYSIGAINKNKASIHQLVFVDKVNEERLERAKIEKLEGITQGKNEDKAKTALVKLNKLRGFVPLDEDETRQDILDTVKCKIKKYSKTQLFSTSFEETADDDSITSTASALYTKAALFGIIPSVFIAVVTEHLDALSFDQSGLTWFISTAIGILVALTTISVSTYSFIHNVERQQLERKLSYILRFATEYSIDITPPKVN